MEYWEFLLQKEGDRSWLPLESPDVEILEGRYRVVARSSRANTSVEIRVTHQVADEVPPKRRAQKRFGRTNKDGLMVVFPFTRMQPGLWEIRCAGDLMSDFLGQSWQHTVCLQVLPQEFESETDWDSEWEMQDEATADSPEPQSNSVATTASDIQPEQEPTQPQPVAATAPEALTTESNVNSTARTLEAANYSVEQLQYIAERISESDASLLPDEAAAVAPASEPALDTSAIAEPVSPEEENFLVTPDALAEPPAIEDLPLQIVLAQSAYMTSWGRPFTLSGRIELQEPVSSITAIASLPTSGRSGEGELQICLRDPQSAQMVVEVRQPFSSQPLPYTFNCTLEIPLTCKTRLLLGEVVFHRPAIAPDATESSTSPATTVDTVIATQAFTLTADLDELLDAIATDLSEEQLLDLPLPNLESESELEPEPELEPEFAESTIDDEESQLEHSYLNLSFLNLGEPSQDRQPFHIQPSTGSPLPPQIYRPSTHAEPSKTPALPVIQGFYPASEPSLEQVDTPEAEESEEIASETTAEAVVEDLPPEPALDRLNLDSDLGDLGLADPEAELTATVESPEDVLPEPVAPPEVSEAPVEATAQPLNFQERFWARLNALASDANWSEWLKEDDTESPNALEIADSPELATAPDVPEANDVDLDSERAIASQSSEIVVHPTARPPEDEWVAHEIVVEDEPVVAAPQPVVAAPEAPQPALLDPDAAIPNPQLEVPTGELVSGKPVTVRVRMPDLPHRIYVKFWVNDRQTRSLLDGPRWLVDFTPTGLGDLEATTQLTVP
ncbi:MAG TPA: hypothetical protein V6C63_10120, partial [Allocoleopsis sp.]